MSSALSEETTRSACCFSTPKRSLVLQGAYRETAAILFSKRLGKCLKQTTIVCRARFAALFEELSDAKRNPIDKYGLVRE